MPVIDPALTFDFTTDQFPLRAGNNDVMITITATNNTTKPVDLKGFYISFPIGTSATSLTNNSAKIVADTPEGIDTPEKSEAEGQVKYTYDTTFTLKSGKSLVFKFHKVDINSAPGTSNVFITEIHSSSDMRVRKIPVTKFPKGWGKVIFMVEKPVIPFDGEAAMNWEGPEGATYTIEYYSYKDRKIVKVPAINEPSLSNKGRYPAFGGTLRLNKTTDFYLNVELVADGEVYRAQEQKTIVVESPPLPVIKSFIGSKKIISGDAPEKVTFRWEVENAYSIELSGDGIQTENVTNLASYDILTNKSGMYHLKAMNEDREYRQLSAEVQTTGDFLNFHKFRLYNENITDPGDFDGMLVRKTLDETMSFLTQGMGTYTVQDITYTKRMGERSFKESSRESDVIDFNWKVINGKIEVDLKGGRYVKNEHLRLAVVNGQLRYEAAPSKGFRDTVEFFSQRLQMVNEALPFDLAQADFEDTLLE